MRWMCLIEFWVESWVIQAKISMFLVHVYTMEAMRRFCITNIQYQFLDPKLIYYLLACQKMSLSINNELMTKATL